MRGVECTWEPPGELPIPRALGSQQISSTEEHADVKGEAQALVPPDHGPRTLHRRIPRYPASARVGFEALRAESREWRLDPPGGFLRSCAVVARSGAESRAAAQPLPKPFTVGLAAPCASSSSLCSCAHLAVRIANWRELTPPCQHPAGTTIQLNGGVAQRIEQEPSKLLVAGSIPAAPARGLAFACQPSPRPDTGNQTA